MKRILTRYFNSWWLPALVYIFLLGVFVASAVVRWQPLAVLANVLFWLAGLAFLTLIAASIWNFIQKRRRIGVINLLLIFGCGAATVFALGFVMFVSMFGPSEDGFADNLTIPEGIEITEPDQNAGLNLLIIWRGNLDHNWNRWPF